MAPRWCGSPKVSFCRRPGLADLWLEALSCSATEHSAPECGHPRERPRRRRSSSLGDVNALKSDEMGLLRTTVIKLDAAFQLWSRLWDVPFGVVSSGCLMFFGLVLGGVSFYFWILVCVLG